MIFEYFIRARIFPDGRVSISFSPLPFTIGRFVDVDEAIKILEEEKKKFNEEIDQVLNELRRIKRMREKWR